MVFSSKCKAWAEGEMMMQKAAKCDNAARIASVAILSEGGAMFVRSQRN